MTPADLSALRALMGNGPQDSLKVAALGALPSLLAHVAAQAERIEALEGALLDVADHGPFDFAPNIEWCWCGGAQFAEPTAPVEHQPYCEQARRVLGGKEGT